MKVLFASVFCLLIMHVCLAQKSASQTDRIAIKTTITQFLRWNKEFQADTSRKRYSITKGGYPDTTTRVRINYDGLEKYLNEYLKTTLVSETFTNKLRLYFKNIDKDLATMPIQKVLAKIDGLDIDPVLQTYDSDAITDHIDQSKINQLHIIYNKALISMHFSKYADMLFILTREQKHWVIDYAGPDFVSKYSVFGE